MLRRDAARASYLGILALTLAPHEAEGLLRHAIGRMVDAFLLDRKGNADLFGRAHALGTLVERRFSCRWTKVDKYDELENDCAIFALHNRIGLSPGGRNWGRCTICDADDFQCNHVPGRVYDGRLCQRHIHRWDGDEISFTPRPRDPRCFRVWALVEPDAAPADRRCRHCTACPGRSGASADDLSPASWPTDPEALVTATVQVSRNAAKTSRGLLFMS